MITLSLITNDKNLLKVIWQGFEGNAKVPFSTAGVD